MARAAVLAVLAVLVPLSSACGGGEACPDGWKEPLGRAELDRPLLSVWGRGEEVWLVGGGVGASASPPGLVMRFDGDAWSRMDTASDRTLWWVWGPDGPGDVWMVGERGLALRWDGASLRPVETGTTATLFGVWGSGPDDVWLVGGTPGGGGPDDVVLHWDGQTLAPDAPPARDAAFFKVWGAARDDVWVVGESGTIWHRSRESWEPHDAGTRDTLTTVHGCGASEVYAVGGQAIHRWDGEAWAAVAGAQVLSTAVGVACGPDAVSVVGNGGLKLRLDRASGRWLDETLQPPFYTDFHATWIAPSGAIWAAGGNYNAPALSPRVGMIGFRGCPVPTGSR